MSAPHTLPNQINTPDDLAVLEAAATKVDTPCGDGTMTWRIWGQGAPVVLIHGGSGSWAHWCRNIVPLVAGGHQVCIPDLPGCGDSASPPNGADGDALPVWLGLGIRSVLGTAAFDLVGFSFGAMVSGLFAVAYPELVRKLILVDAAALCRASVTAVGLKPWTQLTDAAARTEAHRFNLQRLMFAREASADALALHLYTTGLQCDRLAGRRLSHSDILRQSLPQLRCPVWGIWGREDILFRGLLDDIAPALKAAPRFVALSFIASAGHWVQYEAAARFNETLQAILARHDLC